jgi:hypothetical protein
VPAPGGSEGSRAQGAVTLERDWSFTIPRLDPSPAEPFVFYVQNCCVPKFIQVRLPDYATTSQGKKIPIIQAANNLFAPLLPVPFK